MKFVVVQAQDSNDCRELKEKLLELCKKSKKEVLIRIACHELEAWYFGDMNVLSKAYGVDLSAAKRKRKYQVPDAIMNPKAELKRLLPEHQQISGARKIAPIIDIENNPSGPGAFYIRRRDGRRMEGQVPGFPGGTPQEEAVAEAVGGLSGIDRLALPFRLPYIYKKGIRDEQNMDSKRFGI